MELNPEEQDRADLYALLAALLLAPDAALLDALAQVTPPDDGDAGELDRAWAALIAAARRRGRAALDEYDLLFVAAGSPRVAPYHCRYLADWLMNQQLAALREDLRRGGLMRVVGATELEDHLGALCEAMGLLVRHRRPAAMQHAFFRDHLAGWSRSCLEEIAADPGSDFYRAFARFAQVFLVLEEAALQQHSPGGGIAPIRTREGIRSTS